MSDLSDIEQAHAIVQLEAREGDFCDESDYDPECIGCDGTGVRITCMDDMCAGSGECMHGDGEEICPVHGW